MKTRKITFLGMSLCLALILSYAESLIPFGFGIPGIKLGLPNLVVLVLMYSGMSVEAIVVSILRIILAGFMFGNLTSIIYSLAGGILSFAVMLFFKNLDVFTIRGVSVSGGLAHNIGQLIIAGLVVSNFDIVEFYLPYLLISGIITGLIIGLVAGLVLPYIKRSGAFTNDSLH